MEARLGLDVIVSVEELNRLIDGCKAVVSGFIYDPGQSDLDDEQPIHVSMNLGQYRRIRGLIGKLDQRFLRERAKVEGRL